MLPPLSARTGGVESQRAWQKQFSNQLVANGREIWNREMSKIEIEDDNIDNLRTFYSCLYRSMLFPRSFYEIDAKGQVMHYSPYNGEVRPGYMFTDTGFWDTFRCLFPFLNLMYPSMNQKMQEGLVNTYKESGFCRNGPARDIGIVW